MEYNWDKNKLKLLKKEYLNLKNYTEGLLKEDLENIEYNLLQLDEMMYIITGSDSPISFENYIEYVDETNFLPKNTLINFQNIPAFIQNWLLNSMEVLEQFKESCKGIVIPKIHLTTQEIVCLSHDFFQWIPNKNYVKFIDKYLNKDERLLRIQNIVKSNPYVGSTFVFYYPYYIPYFLIEKDNTINDFCTLNHELAHGIYMASDTAVSRYNNHKFLFELEGYWFDFLSRIFLKEKKIVSSKTLEIIEYYEFIIFLDIVISFYIQSISVFLYQNKKAIHLENIVAPFQMKIDEDSLSLYLQEETSDLVTYALSFLVNSDLEKIADSDLEFAFLNFEQIRHNKSNNIEQNLYNHGITFMNDGYQNLQEKIRKLNLIKE